MFSRPILIAFFVTVTSAAVAVGVRGQPSKTLSADEQKKQAEVVLINNLIFEARSQTPEIAADALIAIAESGKVRSLKLRRQILDQAFGLASQAKYAVKISYAGFTDNRVWAVYSPLELNLDKLSLRARVIGALLKFDKVRARQLFLNEMPRDIDLPPLGCEEGQRYYDVSDYYQTASSVFNETFPLKERAEPAFVDVLLPFVNGMSSPSQVNPIAKMLVDLKLRPSQLSFLAASYAQMLARIRNDDFTFRRSILRYPGIKGFIEGAGETNRPEMVRAFRDYVLKQLNGTRCSEGIKRNLKNPLESKYELPGSIRALNNDLLKEKPIGPEEIDPENIVKSVPPPDYWDRSPKDSGRLDAARRLRFGRDEQELSKREKQKPEWLAELDKYLLELGMWEADEEETREDYFNKKSIILFALAESIVPRGAARDAALKEYVLFLSRNELRGESRLQWFLHIKRNLFGDIVRQAKAGDREKTIEIIRGVKNPTIDLYCDLLALKEEDKKSVNDQK